ncbi:hypothetical protein [Parafrankia sp. FMc2]|uniref:hypothetical protein n=1 Tax=Parafrankia sp. FMc2 TaxID=3233196 RepID=UPI0034D5CB9C
MTIAQALGWILRELGDRRAAVMVLQVTYTRRARVLGAKHPATVETAQLLTPPSRDRQTPAEPELECRQKVTK